MSNKPEIFLGDVGTTIRVSLLDGETSADLSGFVNIDFLFRKPSGELITRPGQVEEAGSGIIYYVTQEGDIDEYGRWKLQIAIDLNNWAGRSSIGDFIVHPNI